MKTRSAFVSNSSSSSFILSDLSLLRGKSYRYVQLTESQIKEIEKEHEYVQLMSHPLYLTQYISDGDDLHYQLLFECRKKVCSEYMEGNHGYPYNDEAFDELTDRVWILKDHNK